jgi:hypothetical protein
MRDYFIKNSLVNFPQTHSTFETPTSLCIVSSFYPFQLSKISIQSKYLMDIILNQIAKILHTL